MTKTFDPQAYLDKTFKLKQSSIRKQHIASDFYKERYQQLAGPEKSLYYRDASNEWQEFEDIYICNSPTNLWTQEFEDFISSIESKAGQNFVNFMQLRNFFATSEDTNSQPTGSMINILDERTKLNFSMWIASLWYRYAFYKRYKMFPDSSEQEMEKSIKATALGIYENQWVLFRTQDKKLPFSVNPVKSYALPLKEMSEEWKEKMGKAIENLEPKKYFHNLRLSPLTMLPISSDTLLGVFNKHWSAFLNPVEGDAYGEIVKKMSKASNPKNAILSLEQNNASLLLLSGGRGFNENPSIHEITPNLMFEEYNFMAIKEKEKLFLPFGETPQKNISPKFVLGYTGGRLYTELPQSMHQDAIQRLRPQLRTNEQHELLDSFIKNNPYLLNREQQASIDKTLQRHVSLMQYNKNTHNDTRLLYFRYPFFPNYYPSSILKVCPTILPRVRWQREIVDLSLPEGFEIVSIHVVTT